MWSSDFKLQKNFPKNHDLKSYVKYFCFRDLSELSMVQINVHKDYDKKKKKDKSSFIGKDDKPRYKHSINATMLNYVADTISPGSLTLQSKQ